MVGWVVWGILCFFGDGGGDWFVLGVLRNVYVFYLWDGLGEWDGLCFVYFVVLGVDVCLGEVLELVG